MQAFVSEVEKSTVSIETTTHKFRVWYNPRGYWQTDIWSNGIKGTLPGLAGSQPEWIYFASAQSLIQAMTNVAITL